MERRTGLLVGLLALGAVLAFSAPKFFHRDAPAPESTNDPLTTTSTPPPLPSAQIEEDASHYGVAEAVADLAEDNYIHKAFVAVGPGDVTVWMDHDSTFRTLAGDSLCEKCLATDFVATRDHVAWLQLLETHIPGFDASVRTFSIASGWKKSDAGEALSWGDRAAALNNATAIATDGTAVYVAEGKDDAAGDGIGRSVVRIDLAKGAKTTLATMPTSIRNLVFASGELFVTFSPTINPVWHVRAISTKTGAVRDVVSFEFQLPDQTASSTDLYFSYRDAFERTSRGHLASVALTGGTITNIYDTAPNELIGDFAADESGLYVVRFIGHWVLTRFAKGAPPHDLAQFDAMPRAIATRKADIAVAFLDELKIVPKSN